jgi:preprotein translocase subunit SecG
MLEALPIIQIVLSIILIGGILLQQSDASIGAAFGGSDMGGDTFHTKRGFEKILYQATIVIAVLFVVSTFANLLLQ